MCVVHTITPHPRSMWLSEAGRHGLWLHHEERIARTMPPIAGLAKMGLRGLWWHGGKRDARVTRHKHSQHVTTVTRVAGTPQRTLTAGKPQHHEHSRHATASRTQPASRSARLRKVVATAVTRRPCRRHSPSLPPSLVVTAAVTPAAVAAVTMHERKL